MPKIKSSRRGNDYFWQESDETERLPVEPDALFTLGFAASTESPARQAHFFYEGDRGTMNTTDMLKKLRAYYHFVKKQQRHREAFGIHPIRAVLIETTNETRARRLMELVHHPLLCGRDTNAQGSFGSRFRVCFANARRVLLMRCVLPTPKCCFTRSGPCPTAVCTASTTLKTDNWLDIRTISTFNLKL